MKIAQIILSLISLFIFQTYGYAYTDQSLEPADKYLLKVNDEVFPIELNKRLQLPDAQVILSVNPNKKFNYGGFHFEYSRKHTFEASLKNQYLKSWTLSGNDAKIIVQNYKTLTNHKAMAKMFVKSYGKENCRQVKCKMRVASDTLFGTELIITTNGIKLSQEIYSFENSEGTKMLILQDNVSASGAHSAEYIKIRRNFKKLFSVDE